MTVDPTRDEWLAARDALVARVHSGSPDSSADEVTEAALGCPCPPEPAPEPLRKDCYTLVETCGGVIRARGLALTPDEADAMACSLIEHAAYARKQQAQKHTESYRGPPSLGVSPLQMPGDGIPPSFKAMFGSHNVRPWPGDTYRDDEEAPPERPVCGRILDVAGSFKFYGNLVDAPRCQRPKGHPDPGGCRAYPLTGDGDEACYYRNSSGSCQRPAGHSGAHSLDETYRGPPSRG